MTYPNIETRADYDEFVTAFKRGVHGLRHRSSGPCPGCTECELSDDPTEHERELAAGPWFSWLACDICQRDLGGDREPFHWIAGVHEVQHGECCVDCVYFMEYGKLDDSTMMIIEEG